MVGGTQPVADRGHCPPNKDKQLGHGAYKLPTNAAHRCVIT